MRPAKANVFSSQISSCSCRHNYGHLLLYSSTAVRPKRARYTGYGKSLRVCAQDEEYFDEGAAQVKRLLDRDRKEVLKDQNAESEYESEYERPGASDTSSQSTHGGNGASTSQSSAYEEELRNMKNPMRQAYKPAPKKGAFGSSSKSPFGSEAISSQKDMWDTMEPVEEDTDEPWWKQISFGQIAIVLSFLTITGVMLGTVWVTVKLGGVHFNE